MLSVGHNIMDHILEEDLHNSTSFFIDEARDSLHPNSARKPSDNMLRDALNVITIKDFVMVLGTALS